MSEAELVFIILAAGGAALFISHFLELMAMDHDDEI